jgi:branched-chain amino acid aminotransferase
VTFYFYFSGMKFICLDGKMLDSEAPVLLHDNRSFRYGDGLFETMKMIDGRILLKEYHFERLLKSLSLLSYEVPPTFTAAWIERMVHELATKNECLNLCRIRLTVYRGNGNLYPVPPAINVMIECTPLNEQSNRWADDGFIVDIFPEIQKSCDVFSTIKSANCLPYVLGTMYAAKNKLDDCIILNTNGNIADSTIANIFLLHGEKISTPSLTEGCINGVMRRHLLSEFDQHGYSCEEKKITRADVDTADEIFLTNAINGIRWVKTIASKKYTCPFTFKIYKRFIEPIFA